MVPHPAEKTFSNPTTSSLKFHKPTTTKTNQEVPIAKHGA
jgi:hypothetical protein